MPPTSEPGGAPTDDPEWVKGVVAKALLHATNEDRAPLAPTPVAPIPGEWPSMKTEIPDFSERPAEDVTVPPGSPPPAVSELSPPPVPSTTTAPATPSRSPESPAPASPAVEWTTPESPTPAPAETNVVASTEAPLRPPPVPTSEIARPDVPPLPPPITKQQSSQSVAHARSNEVATEPQPAPSKIAEAIEAHESAAAPNATDRHVVLSDIQDGMPTQFEDRRQSSVSVASGSRSGDDHLMEEADATTDGYRSSDLRTILEWLAVIVAALSVALLIKAFVLQAFWIPSVSMETTVNEGDRILVNKVSYRLHEVRRGDLVVFKKLPGTGGNTDDLIKRAIALPGETIEVRDDGRIWIWGPGETPNDAKRLEEPYLSPDDAFLTIPSSPADPSSFGDDNCTNGPSATRCTLGPDNYFMMGDNRNLSQDSRSFGPIPEENIVGRAFLRIWPIGDIDSL